MCAQLVLTEPLDLDRAAEAKILDRLDQIVQKITETGEELRLIVIHQPLIPVRFRWRKLIINANDRHYKEKVAKRLPA